LTFLNFFWKAPVAIAVLLAGCENKPISNKEIERGHTTTSHSATDPIQSNSNDQTHVVVNQADHVHDAGHDDGHALQHALGPDALLERLERLADFPDLDTRKAAWRLAKSSRLPQESKLQ